MRYVSVTFAALLCLATCTWAADWPQWRGPAFNGSSPETGLPETFTQTENVKWAVDLPGPSAATPIIYGDRVYISSTDAEDNLLALCLDRKTGKELWRHRLSQGGPIDSKTNMANASPATDGKLVVFFYSTGDIACITAEGEKRWQQNVVETYGDFAFQWTFGASPTLYEERVYLPILQRDTQVHGRGGKGDGPIPSFILCLDVESGKTVFEQKRESEARRESKESYTTLIPYEKNGRKELLLAGGDCLTGHDPATGKELWRWGTWNPKRINHWRLVPSPVPSEDVILVCAPKGDPVYAAPTGLSSDASGKPPVWQTDDPKISTDVCTPAYYQGHYYVVHDKQRYLTKVEPKAGKTIWQMELPGRQIYRASPTVADGKIYNVNHDGLVSVVSTEDGKLLNSTQMGEEDAEFIRSSVAVAQGNLFIRTNRHLYCIGK